MTWFSEKRIELEAKKNNLLGKIELLDEIEEEFKRKIKKEMEISNEIDESGNIWINSSSLLEELDLEEWDLKKGSKLMDKGLNTGKIGELRQ